MLQKIYETLKKKSVQNVYNNVEQLVNLTLRVTIIIFIT